MNTWVRSITILAPGPAERHLHIPIYPTLQPFSNGSNVVGFPDTYQTNTYFGAVTYTHTFTPSLLNEFRLTAQRLDHTQAIPATTEPTASHSASTSRRINRPAAYHRVPGDRNEYWFQPSRSDHRNR